MQNTAAFANESLPHVHASAGIRRRLDNVKCCNKRKQKERKEQKRQRALLDSTAYRPAIKKLSVVILEKKPRKTKKSPGIPRQLAELRTAAVKISIHVRQLGRLE